MPTEVPDEAAILGQVRRARPLAAGAEPGFGKAELYLPQTEEKLRRFLT